MELDAKGCACNGRTKMFSATPGGSSSQSATQSASNKRKPTDSGEEPSALNNVVLNTKPAGRGQKCGKCTIAEGVFLYEIMTVPKDAPRGRGPKPKGKAKAKAAPAATHWVISRGIHRNVI